MSTPPREKTYQLDDHARLLPAVGARREGLFARLLGIDGNITIGDLLTLYPRDYQDRRSVSRIRDLRGGEIATFHAQIMASPSDKLTSSGKTVTHVPVSDGTGTVSLRWFNQPFMKKRLFVSERYVVTGKVERFGPELSVTQPDMEKLEISQILSGGRIVPIYPLTDGLFQPVARTALSQALPAAVQLREIIPASILSEYRLLPVREAVANIHFPRSMESLEQARRRLKFEELFLIQALLAVRKAADEARTGIKIKIDDPIAAEIRKMIPFAPTAAQKRVVREIFRDLVRSTPMNRLLQGDVGSGKTIVAAIAVVAVVRNGLQAALMAPTEILAEQHAATFQRLLEPLGIPVWLLTGSVPQRERQRIVNEIKDGRPGVALGTHALIQDSVEFQRLAFVIVDEQHRFGVEQRQRLQQQGATSEDPHVLVMTATPIPRTLSLTAYGHLDVSVIDEMPPGRSPIRTEWAPHSRRKDVYRFVREQALGGRQAYVVCPLVEDSDKVECASATRWYEILRTQVLAGLRIGLVHGKLKGAEKESVMDQFRRGELDVLTATTVIEVGVDVPNATVMVIEDANRFGLAQLHQLRGRVGRGAHEGSCFLVTHEQYNPEGSTAGLLPLEPEQEVDEIGVSQRRMGVLLRETSGFRIAEEDFDLRGVGIYFGTAQHGASRLRIADLRRDFKILQEARKAAFDMIRQDPCLERPEHTPVRERLADLHIDYDIGEDYSSVA